MKRLLLILLPTFAFAEPRIETIDRGEVVEVIAHDVTAITTDIIPVRSRLEVPIAATAPIHLPSTDPTIVVTEIERNTLSVKLVHDRPFVKTIAPLAKAIQVGNDLHLLIPRALPAAGATITLPEPTVPKIEAPVAPAPEAKPEAKVEAKPEAKIETKPEPILAPEPKAEPAPLLAKAEPPKPIQQAIAQAPEQSPISRFSMFGVLGLVAIGAGAWIMKRKKGKQAPLASIEVIAQRSIGGKAKVVWLAAGTREMVIAVTPQNVRMLGQWKKNSDDPVQPGWTSRPAPLPQAQVVESPVKSDNPAVAGILKLRARTQAGYPRASTQELQQAVNNPAYADHVLDDDIATGDLEADSAWAKEILAATRSHGLRGSR